MASRAFRGFCGVHQPNARHKALDISIEITRRHCHISHGGRERDVAGSHGRQVAARQQAGVGACTEVQVAGGGGQAGVGRGGGCRGVVDFEALEHVNAPLVNDDLLRGNDRLSESYNLILHILVILLQVLDLMVKVQDLQLKIQDLLASLSDV